jgi:hypothetical protein
VRYGFNLPNFGDFADVRALAEVAEVAAVAERPAWSCRPPTRPLR